MRCEYKAALFGGIPLGVTMLCFSLVSSPGWMWDSLFLVLSGGIGALFAYCCYKSSAGALSLTKGPLVGGVVGFAAGLMFFICSAAIYLVIANAAVVFNAHSMSVAVIGIVRLALASGFGGLVLALIIKLSR